MRKNLALRLADAERQLAELQALAHIGTWEFDLINDRIRWSAETFRIFGLERGLAQGAQEPDFADFLMSIQPEDARMLDEAIQRAITERESYRLDLRICCPNGSQKHIHAQGSPVCNENQEVVRIIGTVLDITERKRAEERLFQDATHDALTGLVNRRTLHGILEKAVEAARQSGMPLSLCLSDIDNFKGVNDTYGHSAGDEVLTAFGTLLGEGTRETDVAGRLGGDEFCVIFPATRADDAAICVERIRLRLQQMVFSAGTARYSATATFGIAQLKEGMTPKGLIEAADGALYRAKEQGRNCAAIAPGF